MKNSDPNRSMPNTNAKHGVNDEYDWIQPNRQKASTHPQTSWEGRREEGKVDATGRYTKRGPTGAREGRTKTQGHWRTLEEQHDEHTCRLAQAKYQ